MYETDFTKIIIPEITLWFFKEKFRHSQVFKGGLLGRYFTCSIASFEKKNNPGFTARRAQFNHTNTHRVRLKAASRTELIAPHSMYDDYK